MKRIFIMLISCLLLIALSVQGVAEGEWVCPSCGETAAGNFCSSCGEKKPESDSWVCPLCGTESTGNFCSNCGAKRSEGGSQDGGNRKIRLDLNIEFEKNSYFSTYDVKLFVDDEWVTTIRHGVDYSGTLYVTPGKHIILFREDSSSYPNESTSVINISEPSLYHCEIHAEMSTIKISGERTEEISDNRPAPDAKSAVSVDGNIQLKVSVEFRKNAVFSTYDVDLYLDDVYVATLPHGKNYENTLLISKGKHVITFYKSGNQSIRGSYRFSVDSDAYFSCRIEATRKKVDISREKLSY